MYLPTVSKAAAVSVRGLDSCLNCRINKFIMHPSEMDQLFMQVCNNYVHQSGLMMQLGTRLMSVQVCLVEISSKNICEKTRSA